MAERKAAEAAEAAAKAAAAGAKKDAKKGKKKWSIFYFIRLNIFSIIIFWMDQDLYQSLEKEYLQSMSQISLLFNQLSY